jgi:hypothetical protein
MTQIVTLSAFIDYQKTTSANEPVIVSIADQLLLKYNRATRDFNRGTDCEQNRDIVPVTAPGITNERISLLTRSRCQIFEVLGKRF